MDYIFTKLLCMRKIILINLTSIVNSITITPDKDDNKDDFIFQNKMKIFFKKPTYSGVKYFNNLPDTNATLY
jgi:hypothetical protein